MNEKKNLFKIGLDSKVSTLLSKNSSSNVSKYFRWGNKRGHVKSA